MSSLTDLTGSLQHFPIPVEICIECRTPDQVRRDVVAAFQGGANRVELCADMPRDGLTPDPAMVRIARDHAPTQSRVLSMIRPRGGDFTPTASDIQKMLSSMERAFEAGAHGVVFGVLTDGWPDSKALAVLTDRAKKLRLETTFHRAFDATSEPIKALHQLIEAGLDRVLTSGTRWGSSRTALDGIPQLKSLLSEAADGIELVVGGGVRPESASDIVRRLRGTDTRFSLHAWSSVMTGEVVDERRVRALYSAANGSLPASRVAG